MREGISIRREGPIFEQYAGIQEAGTPSRPTDGANRCACLTLALQILPSPNGR